MITSELDVTSRHTAAGRPPVRRATAGYPPARLPARPRRVARAGSRRRVALCPEPVRRRDAGGPSTPLRRAVATAGLLLASAAAVVGLGLLADASTPVPDGAPAAVMLETPAR